MTTGGTFSRSESSEATDLFRSPSSDSKETEAGLIFGMIKCNFRSSKFFARIVELPYDRVVMMLAIRWAPFPAAILLILHSP